MTLTPIPLVASLRETSVLFGAIIAVLFLKQPLRITRVAAAVTREPYTGVAASTIGLELVGLRKVSL